MTQKDWSQYADLEELADAVLSRLFTPVGDVSRCCRGAGREEELLRGTFACTSVGSAALMANLSRGAAPSNRPR
jgi:hypothetical protein